MFPLKYLSMTQTLKKSDMFFTYYMCIITVKCKIQGTGSAKNAC